MKFVDMHCDTLESISAHEALINPYNFSHCFSQLQFFAVFVADLPPSHRLPAAREKLDYFHSRFEGEVVLDSVSLQRSLSSPHGALLTLEGLDFLCKPEDLLEFRERGVRLVNPVWNYKNRFAACNLQNGTPEDTGFSPLGKELISVCEELGIILDVSHLSDRGIDDLLSLARYPFLASHSNCRAICPSPRNLTDGQIRSIFNQGGVIGLNLYPKFILPDGECTLSDLLRHVEHFLSLGGEDHLALGFDIDGTGGEYPEPFSLTESFHDAFFELLSAEYPAAIVEKICYKNALSFLEAHFAGKLS